MVGRWLPGSRVALYQDMPQHLNEESQRHRWTLFLLDGFINFFKTT